MTVAEKQLRTPRRPEPGTTLPVIAGPESFGSLTEQITSVVLTRRTPVFWWCPFSVGTAALMMFVIGLIYLVYRGVGIFGAILALRDVDVPPMATESIVAQIRGGLRFVHGSPNLVTVIALGFFGAFLGMPLLTFLPVVTRDVFHRDVGFYTRLMTFSGLGAFMGALVLAWLGKKRHMGRILLILLMPQPLGP